jgi:hypothetical protein
MSNLIVPMAGRSSRFPNVRPKWMLTHPRGRFMAIESILGFNLDYFENIYFVYLKEHEEHYHFRKGFIEELEELNIHNRTQLVELANPTRDQPETVSVAIQKALIRGSIVIKDSDNQFKYSHQEGNFVCYFDLNQAGLIKPGNKSYILTDDFSKITNIIEKKVISSRFCVGAYGFENTELFLGALNRLDPKSDRYISNVIYECILHNHTFEAVPVKDYYDWGTLEDWQNFKRTHATLFVDMDGVIVNHSSSHFPPYYGESDELKENTEILRRLYQTGKFQIIITTSRPGKYRKITEKQLKKFNIGYDVLLMDMFHSKRIIINDYSHANPFKSCDAINLKRNAQDLKEILRDSLGIDYEEIDL